MNWFQRYGFPGMYFWGLLILWLVAFHPYKEIEQGNVMISDCTEVDIKIIGSIIAGSFLPIGYLISILGQILYLACPFLGAHMRAIRRAGVVFRDNDRWWRRWEPKLEALTLLLCVQTDRPKRLTLSQNKFIQDWVRQRMNVLAINLSLMLATVLSPLSAFILIKVFDLTTKIEWHWFRFAIIVSMFVFVVSFISWLILNYQVTEVITGYLRVMAELPISGRDRIGLGFWLVLILICFVVTLIFYAWLIAELAFF